MDDKEYNSKVGGFGRDYRALNKFVMDHTLERIESDGKLSDSVKASIENQYVALEGEDLGSQNAEGPANTKIIVSKKRSFEAASSYKGKKTCVLNFANNHNVGGAPWSAGAQEESMCRTSTLYPCLKAAEQDFHVHHKLMYASGDIDDMGNDDIIWTPNVCVFKSDESAPKMLPETGWFNVDVISSAAPQLSYSGISAIGVKKYDSIMRSRIRRILDVARKEKEQVLILGAFGCGAFHNPPEIVAKIFKELFAEYNFETVEFAVFCREESPESNYSIFERILK